MPDFTSPENFGVHSAYFIFIVFACVIFQYKSNAYLKRCSLHMQQNRQAEAKADLKLAEEADPDNADVYQHRGQLYILCDELSSAVENFDRAVELRPEFTVGIIQRAYSHYRHALASGDLTKITDCLSKFEAVVEQNPTCVEGYALLGQVYMNQLTRFDDAEKLYRKATNISENNANIWVHRGLLCLAAKNDFEKAINMVKKAVEIDPNCEFAYETLGTIEMQRGNLEAAIAHIDRGLSITRTEFELVHLFTSREAAVAQLKLRELYGLGLMIPRPGL
jgi:import receptor subunit TOM70